jgi:NitT/TauT family transport system substrate-binding protein
VSSSFLPPVARSVSRRVAAATLAAATVATAFLPVPALAQPKPLQKVRLVAATSVLDVTYTMLTLAKTLGYYQAEGLDVDLQPAGGSLQVIQQLVGGGAELGAGSGNAMLQANAKNNLPVRVAYTITASDWAVGVDADGPIKTAKDLKGKTIGVFSLASGGVALLNGLLRTNGIDPAKDVEMISVGMGAAPVEALRSGKAQGLIYWGSALTGFENAGLHLRRIAGDDWSMYPEYSLGVMQATIDKNPEMVVGFARAMAKAAVYATTNPTCAVQLHWKNYPSTKGSGADDATLLKRDLRSLQTQLDSMVVARRNFGDGKQWGKFDTGAWNKLSAFMLAGKQIDAPFDPSGIAARIPGLSDKINAFDAQAVMEAARACKV